MNVLQKCICDAANREPYAGCPVHGQSESACSEADRLTNGARQADYGHPLDDFTRTGRMWAAILGVPEVTPEQVAMCMVAVKLSRECNHPKRDNRVDGAGYFNCLQMVCDERGRRNAGGVPCPENPPATLSACAASFAKRSSWRTTLAVAMRRLCAWWKR